jgi:hypothetical protein
MAIVGTKAYSNNPITDNGCQECDGIDVGSFCVFCLFVDEFLLKKDTRHTSVRSRGRLLYLPTTSIRALNQTHFVISLCLSIPCLLRSNLLEMPIYHYFPPPEGTTSSSRELYDFFFEKFKQ